MGLRILPDVQGFAGTGSRGCARGPAAAPQPQPTFRDGPGTGVCALVPGPAGSPPALLQRAAGGAGPAAPPTAAAPESGLWFPHWPQTPPIAPAPSEVRGPRSGSQPCPPHLAAGFKQLLFPPRWPPPGFSGALSALSALCTCEEFVVKLCQAVGVALLSGRCGPRRQEGMDVSRRPSSSEPLGTLFRCSGLLGWGLLSTCSVPRAVRGTRPLPPGAYGLVVTPLGWEFPVLIAVQRDLGLAPIASGCVTPRRPFSGCPFSPVGGGGCTGWSRGLLVRNEPPPREWRAGLYPRCICWLSPLQDSAPSHSEATVPGSVQERKSSPQSPCWWPGCALGRGGRAGGRGRPRLGGPLPFTGSCDELLPI